MDMKLKILLFLSCCFLLLIMMIFGICLICAVKKISVRIVGIVLLAVSVVCIVFVALVFAGIIFQLFIEGALESFDSCVKGIGAMG